MAGTSAAVDKSATEKDSVRMSAPMHQINILADVAGQNRVSVARIVRVAITRYVEDQWPRLRT
ncbi:MAG: hypothetical protein OXE53_06200 [Deltaproteobacteria bacterium]|nr:hypothetical protein [Deltaproteobacteria bacterium]